MKKVKITFCFKMRLCYNEKETLKPINRFLSSRWI